MESVTFENDIRLFYVTATSFPEGIEAAHQKLHGILPLNRERKYFGISRPEQGNGIIYRAAAEALSQGEAADYGLEMLVLKKGTYHSITIQNYMSDPRSIGHAFKQLLADPAIDHEGYCVEWYLNDTDVQCMVRLA